MSENENGSSDDLNRLINDSLKRKRKKYEQLKPKPEKTKEILPPQPEGQLLFDELREAISVIRDFAIKGYFSANAPKEIFPAAYIDLANSCRNALVKILDCERHDIHCAVKYCAAEKKNITKRKTKLWTFARSHEPSGRDMRMGPGRKISVHKNSSFSSILGCKDNKNNHWECRPYLCFSCNNLTEHINYADGKKKWSSFYEALLVFPLRYEKQKDGQLSDFITGFLTFDSPLAGIFKSIPSRLDYVGEPEKYMTELRKTDVYHIGHTIADAIAMGTVLAPLPDRATIYIEGET